MCGLERVKEKTSYLSWESLMGFVMHSYMGLSNDNIVQISKKNQGINIFRLGWTWEPFVGAAYSLSFTGMSVVGYQTGRN